MAIARFEELDAWKQARILTKAVYRLSSLGPLQRDWALRNQMCRAAISVMANIAEGFARKGKIEFVRFLIIAKSSCTELQSHLYIASDLAYIGTEDHEKIFQLTMRVELVISGLIRHLRRT